MNTKFYLLIFLLSVSITTAQTKKQEIVLLGTMHSVPKIVKKSYQPMFKRAKRYQPQAIYVESPMAHDSLSWNYLKTGWSKNYQRFYRLSDSLQKNFALEGEKFNGILKKNLSEMTPEDLNYLITCFAYKRDNGNFEYYTYLLKHGINHRAHAHGQHEPDGRGKQRQDQRNKKLHPVWTGKPKDATKRLH